MSKNSKKQQVAKLQQGDLDPRKKRLFSIILFSVPILFLILLEIGLRIIGYGGNTKLFVSVPGNLSEYKMCNRDVGRRFFFMQSTIPNPSKDLFLKEKPKSCYRIFVLGGSTAAGYPYGDNVMFSRILNFRLADAFPNKRIEVVNTAMSAINSYTLLDFMDEIIANKPDAILIYAGHNEYYGALGVASMESLGKIRWVVKSYLNLMRFKIFLLVRDFIGWIRVIIGNTISDGFVVDPSATLMERIVGEQVIPYKSSIYELGKKQYESNLSDIAQKVKEHGIPILFSELVSNVRDQQPFVSVEQDTLPTAAMVFKQARQLEMQRGYEKAKKSYILAKDLDALRFRAPDEFNGIIHRVAAKNNIPVVKTGAYFEHSSPNCLIGDNLIVDHLHPNIPGYFLMADAFFQTMRENNFITDNWDSTRIKPASFYLNNWVLTGLDSAYADLNIKYLKGGWPFKPKTSPNHSLNYFNPTTKAESWALKILQDESVSLESAHLELAKYYVKQKNYERAFREYRSLIYIIPFDIELYKPAAESLFKLNRFSDALPLLYQSLKVKETAFATKWIGQILLEEGKQKEALPYLEKSYNMNSEDPQLLWYLYRVYLLNSQREKAQQTLNKLRMIMPNHSGS